MFFFLQAEDGIPGRSLEMEFRRVPFPSQEQGRPRPPQPNHAQLPAQVSPPPRPCQTPPPLLIPLHPTLLSRASGRQSIDPSPVIQLLMSQTNDLAALVLIEFFELVVLVQLWLLVSCFVLRQCRWRPACTCFVSCCF